MLGGKERRVWSRAQARAGSIAPAAAWRESLAEALLEVPDVAASWVFTCPPDLPFAAVGTVLPRREGVADAFFGHFQPRFERSELSSRRLTRRFGGKAFAALDHVDDPLLVAGVRRRLLAPLGAADLVHSFLSTGSGEVVGWVSLCTSSPAAELLARAGPELDAVTQLASRSLENALLLAQGCGAHVPRLDRPPTSALSARQRDVAELVGRGFSDLNIAHCLSISEHTVATHLRSIFGKLGLHSRAELAALSRVVAPRERG